MPKNVCISWISPTPPTPTSCNNNNNNDSNVGQVATCFWAGFLSVHCVLVIALTFLSDSAAAADTRLQHELRKQQQQQRQQQQQQHCLQMQRKTRNYLALWVPFLTACGPLCRAHGQTRACHGIWVSVYESWFRFRLHTHVHFQNQWNVTDKCKENEEVNCELKLLLSLCWGCCRFSKFTLFIWLTNRG